VRRYVSQVTLALVVALAAPSAAPAAGSFLSSDGLLNTIWQQSVKTARMMVSPPANLLPACDVPKDRPVILDGVVRDRCQFTGDIAVTGKTLYAADGAAQSPVRGALFVFAAHQHADGLVPSIPAAGDQHRLADYTAYWIEDVHDYVLYSGDLAAARALMPHVVRALDGWYPRQLENGLVANGLGAADYALIDRRDVLVAYYNALYVRALDLGASVARWAGQERAARRWNDRAARLRPVVRKAFWHPAAGAFKDTVSGPLLHSQDANAFAVLSGVATRRQALSAFRYLDGHTLYGYGNSIADADVWDSPVWGIQASRRVYPFMAFFETVARFRTGLDNSALDLIRRVWGYMVKNGPGTTWETIGPYGSAPLGGSWAHGWSSGAAPALTAYVLGVRPTSPGFRTFVVEPHPGGLPWARGVVPTPHGDLAVSWRSQGGKLAVTVDAPPGTQWENRPRGSR
jgi:hypothetical protein